MRSDKQPAKSWVALLLVMGFAAVAAAQAPSGAELREPQWPQPFEVQGPESTSFGFAVTRPGPVTVDVRWQGPPLIVALEGPARFEQVGNGRVVLTHVVTPEELQRGVLWGVRVALQTPANVRVAGQVFVQHAPVDPRIANAAVAEQVRAARRAQAAPHEKLSSKLTPVDAQLRAHLERGERAQSERQMSLLRASQAGVDQARMRMTTGVSTRAVGRGDAAAATQIEQKPKPLMRERPVMGQPTLPAPPSPPLQPQVPPNPVIVSLSVPSGSPAVPPNVPATPVNISGVGFTAEPGEVHFLVNPGMDLIAQVDWWDDGLVRAYVPAPLNHGIQAFDGLIYVVRKSDNVRSAPVSFRFEPALESRTLITSIDKVIGQPGAVDRIANSPGPHVPLGSQKVFHFNDNPFAGYKANDQLFVNERLSSGWIVDEIFLRPADNNTRGGVYLVDKRVGTASPYFNVRWWVDASFGLYGTFANYTYAVVIKGPQGVPDGILVK